MAPKVKHGGLFGGGSKGSKDKGAGGAASSSQPVLPPVALALRDEAIAVLRDELGAGFETATLEDLCKEYTLRGIKAKLQARRVAAVDMTALVTARKNAEDALRSEQETRDAAVAQAKAAVDAELGTV